MPKELVKPLDSEMCPPGYFVVHGHSRTCASGTVTWVDTHLRHRDHVKSGLLRENILFLYWNSKKEYPKVDSIFGFKAGAEYDSPIQFWLDYWKEQGLPFPADIDSLLIKTLKNTIKNYYSWSDDGTRYAEKILALYEKSKPLKTK